MSCSARLPVYIVLIGAFFPRYGGLVLLSLYCIGILLSVMMARLFSRFLVKGEDIPFVMELPPYRMPTMKAIFRHTWEKGKQYLKKMGGVILIASIVVWFLGYFPRYENDVENQPLSVTEMHNEGPGTQSVQENQSYLGKIGKIMEPVIKPLGFDWKLGIGLLSGIGAKELVISSLSVIYADKEVGNVNLGSRIQITPLVAFCYMLFVLIYFPCLATLVAIKQESGSWKWALFAALYTTLLAWILSFAVFQIGTLLL